MVGSNGTMIAIRLVRSKLRKREEHQQHHRHGHANSVHPEQVQCAGATDLEAAAAGGLANPALSASTTSVDSCCAPTATNRSTPGAQEQQPGQDSAGVAVVSGTQTIYATATVAADQFVWQFPPPYPPPNTPPPQYTLYNDQDTLVHGLQADRQGFAKGFRKNLGGRWRRLVKRKPESETCAIPPELKDQLKTIYVY